MPSSRPPRRAARLARVVRPPASSCCSARARASSESNFDAVPHRHRSTSCQAQAARQAALQMLSRCVTNVNIVNKQIKQA